MLPTRTAKLLGIGVVALLGLSLASPSARAALPGALAGRTPNANGAAAGPYAGVVAELKAIRAELQRADHDYKGHRAEAVKLITAAIHALHPPKTGASTAKPHVAGAKTGAAHNATAKSASPSMPQAVSDGILQKAMTQLATVQSQLSSGTGAAATAATALQKAGQELQTALSIK
jgi:hypothetical protein